MDWKTILNPWAEIARLRAELDCAYERMDEYREEAREARREAMGAAAEYYRKHWEMQDRRNEVMQAKMMEMAALRPISVADLPTDAIAALRGVGNG